MDQSAKHCDTPRWGHGTDGSLINWMEEANAIINDVRSHVDDIRVSTVLPNCERYIYINLRTIELNSYCVHVSSLGFRIVGCAYDTIDLLRTMLDENGQALPEAETTEVVYEVFETPYSLLDSISPRYVQSFGEQLCNQLMLLEQSESALKETTEEEDNLVIDEAVPIITEADDYGVEEIIDVCEESGEPDEKVQKLDE